jgi:hypothetical protein
MVRIKGVNSDYKYNLATQEIIDLTKENIDQGTNHPAYLKIFICPNNMPSHVEPPVDSDPQKGWCHGIDADCPGVNKQAGHASICLHQIDGISLESQQAITAKGVFEVQPLAKKSAFKVEEHQVTTQVPFVMQPDGKAAVMTLSETELRVTAAVSIQTQPDNGVQLSVASEGIVLQTPDGATIQIKGNSIEITPGKTGTVKINGSLEVTGEITMNHKKLSA